ncbi:MORN motif, partial [Dillenia turbinata]
KIVHGLLSQVVTTGYGSDQTAIVDLFKKSRSSDRLAVGIFVKPFGFEGQKRQKEEGIYLNLHIRGNMKLNTITCRMEGRPAEGTSKQVQETECFRCGGKGHFASMCPTKNLNLVEREEADQQEDEELTIAERDGHVEEVEDNKRPGTHIFHTNVNCGGKVVKLACDSGCWANVVSQALVEKVKLRCGEHPEPHNVARINDTTLLVSKRNEEIEDILDEQTVLTRKGSYKKILVKWKVKPISESTWITEADFQCYNSELYKMYQTFHSPEMSSSKRGESRILINPTSVQEGGLLPQHFYSLPYYPSVFPLAANISNPINQVNFLGCINSSSKGFDLMEDFKPRVIDTDALLKKDMVTLDEALKSANNAVLSAVNAIYVLTTKFHNKLLDVPNKSSRQYKVRDVVEILDGYKEAKIGFGAGCSIKSSIVKAIYDCPFLDVSLKDLNGIVICILASSGVIENNDVHAFLSTFRQITECTTEILMSTIHELTLEPEILVTTVIIVGSVKEHPLQQTGVLSRLAQHFPFVFNFLMRQHSETDDSHEGRAPAIPHLPEAQQLSDNIEMPTRTSADGFAEVSGTYSEVLQMPPSSSYENVHTPREYENAHQKFEGGPLKVDATSPYSHYQNSRGLAFPREPLPGWNSRPEYQIAENTVEEKSTDFRDMPMLDNVRIYCLPVGVRLADESNDGPESSSMMHDPDSKITAIQNMYSWNELAEEGNEAVAHIHKTASTVLKEKYTDATKKQGGLSERAASMLEAERNSQKKWSPIVEMQYRGGVYRGRCQGGLPEGKGCLSLGDGSMYDGAWRHGNRSGIGTFYFSNGDVFQGSWRDDVMHGKGWFYFHTGDRWFASFWKGKASGEGRFYSKSGDVFFGHFQDGWRHGHFLRINVKGERFAEVWEEGRLVSCKQLDPEICDQ